jgi:hypothetical protein
MGKKQTNEGLFGAAKKLSDAFFDGLKDNMENRALSKVKKNKHVPLPIVKKMTELDRAAKELQQMLKDLGED